MINRAPMSTTATTSTDLHEALRTALAAHDAAALTLMREARRHLRESRAIADRLERLAHPKERRK